MDLNTPTSARHVIAKFGGQASVALAIGKGRSTVAYWWKAGTIPAKWQSKLLALAAERGIDLGPSDFLAQPAASNPTDTTERLPEAKWPGMLPVGDTELPVYVLDDGSRVISRTGATAL